MHQGGAFEGSKRLVDVGDFVSGEWADDEAFAGVAEQEALVLEALQCLSQWRSANSQLLRNFAFAKPLVGPQLSGDDQRAKLAGCRTRQVEGRDETEAIRHWYTVHQ